LLEGGKRAFFEPGATVPHSLGRYCRGLTRRFVKGEGSLVQFAHADVLLHGIGIEFDLKVFSPIHTAGNGSVPQINRLVLTEGCRQDSFLEVNRQPQTVFG